MKRFQVVVGDGKLEMAWCRRQVGKFRQELSRYTSQHRSIEIVSENEADGSIIMDLKVGGMDTERFLKGVARSVGGVYITVHFRGEA